MSRGNSPEQRKRLSKIPSLAFPPPFHCLFFFARSPPRDERRSLKPSTIPSASSSALCGNFLYPDDAKSGSRLMNDRLRDSFRKLSLDEIASSDQLSVNGATSPAARINRIDGTQKLAKQLSLGGSSTFQK